MKRLALGFVVAMLSATGCGQSEGDRCQLDTDCQSGLICVVPTSKQDGGTCQRPGGSDAGVPDLSAAQDLSMQSTD